MFRKIEEEVREWNDKGIVISDIKIRKLVLEENKRNNLKMENMEDDVVMEDKDDEIIKDKSGCNE